MFEPVLFHKAVLVQAKSTLVFSGWLREERRAELQMLHNHPEAMQLFFFWGDGGKS